MCQPGMSDANSWYEHILHSLSCKIISCISLSVPANQRICRDFLLLRTRGILKIFSEKLRLLYRFRFFLKAFSEKLRPLLKWCEAFSVMWGILNDFEDFWRNYHWNWGFFKAIWSFFKESEAFEIISKDMEAFFNNVGHFEGFWDFLNIFKKKLRLLFKNVRLW
jgi:hypothetical protein